MIFKFSTDHRPEDSIEAAQVAFLRMAHDLQPKLLQELHRDIYPKFTVQVDCSALIADLCARWHLTANGVPAEWVTFRAKMTLIWWSRGKATPEQMLNAQKGTRDVEPLEWYDHVTFVGSPVVTRQGELSPYEYSVRFDLTPMPGETGTQYEERLLLAAREQRQEFLSRGQRAYAIMQRLVGKRPRRRELGRDLLWAARFQIAKHEIPQIQKDFKEDSERDVVDKGIHRALEWIGLTRRPPTQTGRPSKQTKQSRQISE